MYAEEPRWRLITDWTGRQHHRCLQQYRAHERIFRRLTRRFGNIPIVEYEEVTYSNLALSDVNVLNCEDVSRCNLNVYKTCT